MDAERGDVEQTAEGSPESLNEPGVGMRSLKEIQRASIIANRRGAVIRLGRHAIGGGFLVGPDLLLTAEHVVPSRGAPLPRKAKNIDVVFDFYDEGGVEAETGKVVEVREILRASPVFGQELAGTLLGDWDVPDTHLDYALLRLARRAGEDRTEDTGTRGWYSLDESWIDVSRSGLVTLYHFPLGGWIHGSFILDGVRLNPARTETRMRYRTNSLPGSSGGFLVDESGLLIGVHNYGTKAENQGIPIWRIAQDLKAFLKAERIPPPPKPTIDIASISKSRVILRPAQVEEVMESIAFLRERCPEAFDGVTFDAWYEFRTGRGGRYVSVLEDAALRAGKPRETAELRACYERQVWLAEPIDLLQRVGRRELLQAYRFAMENSDRTTPPDATSAILRTATRGTRGDPRSPLYRLLARLSFTAGTDADLWLSKELSPQVAADLVQRVKPIAEVTGSTIVVFDLRDFSHGDGATFTLPVHIWTAHPEKEHGTWLEPKAATTCVRTVDAIRTVVEREIQDLMESGELDADPGTTSVEFVLRRGDLGLLPEMGEIDPYGNEIYKAPLAQSFPVLIHLAERFTAKHLVRQWRARLRRIDAFGDGSPEVEWLAKGGILRRIEDMTASCAAFDFVPPKEVGGREDPFYAAVFEGAPFILWSDDEPADRAAVKVLVDTLVSESELDRIPERLLRAWGELKDFDTSIRLIWDDEARLPPGLIPEAVNP